MTPVLAAGMDLAPGFTVIEHLSRTRRLDTFEVYSAERACTCVAKTVRLDRRHDRRARAALVHEGRLLLALTHPHIVRGYELLTEPEVVVVMETLDGETLAHLIDRHPDGLGAAEVAWLGIHVASALRYLHRAGHLHLDVKPSNVVADSGRAKLIDLSLARPPGRWHAGIGTWCNLSPEQARGGMLDPAADVWGLGTVLYEAAVGEPAFAEEAWQKETGWTEPSATWDTGDQLTAGYPQLETVAPSVAAMDIVPMALAEAIDACLAPDPELRPTLEELVWRIAPYAPYTTDGE
jgi:eukaryotic-like serine/threonine-protein kinase